MCVRKVHICSYVLARFNFSLNITVSEHGIVGRPVLRGCEQHSICGYQESWRHSVISEESR